MDNIVRGMIAGFATTVVLSALMVMNEIMPMAGQGFFGMHLGPMPL